MLRRWAVPADSAYVRNPVDSPARLPVELRRRAVRVACVAATCLSIAACATSTHDRRVLVAPPRTPAIPAEPTPTQPPAPAAPAGATGLPDATAAPAPPAAGPARDRLATADTRDAAVRIRITDGQGTRIVTMPLDTYVVGAVRAELAPRSLQHDAVSRVLEVQAIVSRTYAVANAGRHAAEGFDLCDSTHCQLYRAMLPTERDDDAAAQAVAATRGRVITFGGRAIRALFHSNCGGHTAAADQVWAGDAVPYLQPVPDAFCTRGLDAHWAFAADEQHLRGALNADARTAMGHRLDRIEVVARDAAGRATTVRIAGARTVTIRAEIFRGVLRQAFGPRSIQSTWFTIDRQANQFHFAGTGYGHGVGLCQAGAALMAQAGRTPAAIVGHYFPGSRIDSMAALASTLTFPIFAQPRP